MGDAEAIRRDAKNKNDAFDAAKREYQVAKDAKKELLKSLQSRLKTYTNFRNSATSSAKMTFSTMLHKRGFEGELNISHGIENVLQHPVTKDIKGDLTLRVQPATATSKREAATLSGGEKSFAQICLLLALWETMNTRLRCLDEFDVFMDSVNRATSMKMLAEYASKAHSVQFIFISPQDSSLVAGMGDSVRCVRMADPVRSGQTLIRDHIANNPADE